MFFQPDIRTLVFAIWIGDLVSALLVWAYGRDKRNTPSYYAFLAGKAFQVVGWLLFGLRGSVPDALSIGLANFLFFIGFALAAFAMIGIGRQHTRQLFRIFLGLGLAAGTGFLLICSQNLSVRIAYVGLVDAACFTLPVAVFLLRGRSRSRLNVVLSGLYIFCTAALVARAINALLSPQTEIMEWHPWQSLFFLAPYLLMLIGTVGFLLLMKEDSDQELLRAATRDELTGLLNRRTFLEQAEKILAQAVRQGHPLSLFMIDLDHFKRINDAHGHQEGDQALCDFAELLNEQMRRSDVIGRYGGEEFVVLLPHSDEKKALLAAERLRAAAEVRQLRTRTGKTLRYTVSIGVCSLLPDRDTSMDELLRNGDLALYNAKHCGRNRVSDRNELPDGASCPFPDPA